MGLNFTKKKKNRNANTYISISTFHFSGISDESNKYLYFKMLKKLRELYKINFKKMQELQKFD